MIAIYSQRLAEIAHSLLKMSPYDPDTMAGRGLRRYLNEVLPVSEWAQETMRPALIMVIRRLDRTFTKIAKKPAIRVTTQLLLNKQYLHAITSTYVRNNELMIEAYCLRVSLYRIKSKSVNCVFVLTCVYSSSTYICLSILYSVCWGTAAGRLGRSEEPSPRRLPNTVQAPVRGTFTSP